MKKIISVSVMIILSIILSVIAPGAAFAAPGNEPGIYVITERKGVFVRSEASTKGDKVDTLAADDIFTVYSVKDGWGQTDNGWVFLRNSVRCEMNAYISEGSYCLIPSVGRGDMTVSCKDEGSGTQNIITRVKNKDNKLQHFSFIRLDNGYYHIVSEATGYALFEDEEKRVITLPLEYDVNSTAFLWSVLYVGQDRYRIRSSSGLYMDVARGSDKEGSVLQTFRLKDSVGQLYSITPTDEIDELTAAVQRMSGETKGTKVTLTIPLFKQSDKRWRKTMVGSKNIGTIGCLITSLAMKQSYHSGKTVYPDAMRAKLSFDDNDLLWQSIDQFGFTRKFVYSEPTQQILRDIYDQLQCGRPVIVGCRKGKKSHWVLVTGYTDSKADLNDLKTRYFTINDPGSYGDTLADLLDSRPEIIGYVW